MKNVLITGFDPFGGEKINPAFEAVKLLPKTIKDYTLVNEEIPTVYNRCFDVLGAAIERVHPDVVLCVGQAGGRSSITIEKVAINLADARIADNDGMQPKNEPLEPDGDTAYFATVPVEAMVEALRSGGIPAHVSYSAGTFVCNALMYRLLHFCRADGPFSGIRGGFIHVPYATEQGVDKPAGTPTMDLACIVRGLEIAIAAAL